MISKTAPAVIEQDRPVYAIPGHVRWVVQTDTVDIIDTRTNERHRLPYPHAAIWDMLCRNYSRQNIAQLMMAIADLDEQQARVLVETALTVWCSDGLIKSGNCHG